MRRHARRSGRDRSADASRPPEETLRLERGWRAARQAVILGSLGIVLVGVVLGPVALVRAAQAEALGVRSRAGEILGWVALYAGLLQLAFYYQMRP